jgi:hypothetical protein
MTQSLFDIKQCQQNKMLKKPCNCANYLLFKTCLVWALIISMRNKEGLYHNNRYYILIQIIMPSFTRLIIFANTKLRIQQQIQK